MMEKKQEKGYQGYKKSDIIHNLDLMLPDARKEEIKAKIKPSVRNMML